MRENQSKDSDSIEQLWLNMVSTPKPEIDAVMPSDKGDDVDSIEQLWLNMVSTPKPEIDAVMPSDKGDDVDSIEQLWLNTVSTPKPDQNRNSDSMDAFWFDSRNNHAIREIQVSLTRIEHFKNEQHRIASIFLCLFTD